MALKFGIITRPALKGLRPGEKLNEHGISVERTAKGDLTYRINIMVDGQRIHRVVGRESEGVTREQAERHIEKLRTDARADRLDLPAGRKTHRTVAEAALEYIARLKRTGGKDIGNKERHLTQQLVPYFGRTRADKITSIQVQEYVQMRLASAKQATVNRELSTLSHLLNRLAEWKWIKAEARPKIAKGSEPRKPIVVLTDAEAAALLSAAVADYDDRLHLFVAFGLNAAMRHSEIVAVRYDQIDFEHRRVFIPLAKAGEREQPITPALATMLATRREAEADKDGWVFPSTRIAKSPHRQSMEGGFKRAVIRAGLEPTKVTPHVMRHTAITRLVKAGVDLPTIRKISGHKTMAMVMRYVHIHGVHIDRAMAALDSNAVPITRDLHRAA